MPAAEVRDFTGAATCPIYDVRDYKLSVEGGPGIFTFGGLIGEIMISLSAFHETMITRMEMPSFEIRRDQVLKFLEDLLFDGFSPEVCFIRITDDMLSQAEMDEEDEEAQATKAANQLATGQKLDQFGLQFLLNSDWHKAGLNDEIVRDVFYAVCRVNYYEPQEELVIPEDGEEVTEEQKERLQEQNEEIAKTNELFSKLKNYIKLVKPEPPAEGEEQVPDEKQNAAYEAEEKCLVRIMNYRDPMSQEDIANADASAMKASTISKAEHASNMSVGDGGSQAKQEAASDTSSQKALRQIEAFEIEKLSQKVIMLRP